MKAPDFVLPWIQVLGSSGAVDEVAVLVEQEGSPCFNQSQLTAQEFSTCKSEAPFSLHSEHESAEIEAKHLYPIRKLLRLIN